MTPSYGATTSTCAPTPCTWNSPANPSTKSGNDPVLERDHCKTTVIPAYTGIQRGRANGRRFCRSPDLNVLKLSRFLKAVRLCLGKLDAPDYVAHCPSPSAKSSRSTSSGAKRLVVQGISPVASGRISAAPVPCRFSMHNIDGGTSLHSMVTNLETKTTSRELGCPEYALRGTENCTCRLRLHLNI